MAKISEMRIELTPDAKKKLEKMSDRLGMKQYALMSRLVEYFSAQDDTVKAVMLNCFPQQIQSEVAKLILKRR